jgi:hypothetical protein
MSFFLQKDVPLIVTILVAAWTWIISENVKQTDALQILEYRLNHDGKANQILLRNISQSKGIQKIKIFVTCETRRDCFDVKDGYAGTTAVVPPLGVTPTDPGSGDAENANFSFSLTVDAAIILILNLRPNAKLSFSVINSEEYERLRMVDGNSAAACFYRNYWTALLLVLILASIGVLALVRFSAPKAPASPSKHEVELKVRREK